MTRAILSAVVVALLGVILLFAVNLGATRIAPERYRTVVNDAVRDGTMSETLRQTFAPARDIYVMGGSDCLILAMLVTPRDTPVRASISPRVPVLSDAALAPLAPGYGPDEFCRLLARTMEAMAGAPVPLEIKNHHRYLHGAVTLSALVLAVVPLRPAVHMLLVSCFVALGVLAAAAAVRMSAPEPTGARRALAVLIIAAVLAHFYALPIFGRAFSHAPTDICIIGFLLIGLLCPLCRLPEQRFALVVATFGTIVAVLELLTGGIPMGLAALIVLVALGDAPNGAILWRRLVLGIACYAVAITTCFLMKLAAIAIVWGPGEVAAFFDLLGSRMVGPVGTWPALEQWAARLGLDVGVIDRSVAARLLLTAAMVTYSAFVLACGSHVLGAAFVVVPVPLLMVLTWVALRRVRRDRWLAQPQPVLLAASLVPFCWYAAFTWHTATHSFFMVRPLALNLALAAIAAVTMPARRAVT